MRKILLLAVWLCCGVMASDPEWPFMTEGTYPPEDVANAPITGWVALTTTNQLKPAFISKTKIKTDQPELGIGAGWLEIHSSVLHTNFLFRLPRIRAGARIQEAALHSNQRDLWEKQTFTFRGNNYSIDWNGELNDADNGGVFLYRNGKEKTLLKDYFIDECNFMRLVWAGDLDGDGKLDLILSNGSGEILYLSSGAAAGQLVHEAGNFYHDEGC